MEIYKLKSDLNSHEYIKPTQLQKLLHVSRTTVWRLLVEFSAVPGNERAVLELSKTFRLVPLARFMDWLKAQNGQYLKK